MAATVCRLLLLASVLFSPSYCTPQFREKSTTDQEDPCVHEDMDFSGVVGVWQAAVHRIPSLVRYQTPPPALLKRDCLANGTNYCFGDTVNYCTSCGTCCSDASSKWCCPSDGQCCGSSCCASGQACVNGQCFLLPPVTVTSTDTVFTTITHLTTFIDTVAHAVTSTSTVYSFVDVTITSQGATETDWKYVTATSVEKRSLQASPTGESSPSCEERSAAAGGILHSLRQACDAVLSAWEAPPPFEGAEDGKDVNIIRRQETRGGDALPITTTVRAAVTQTADITNGVSTTITTESTTIITKTIFQTRTKIQNAQTTVQATSTLIYISRRPATSTITELASRPASLTPSRSPTGTQTPPTPSGQPATGLSTPTIVGIAIGSLAFAIIAILAVLFFFKWRRRRAANRVSMQGDAFLGTGGHNSYTASGPGYAHMREPTKPRFAPLPTGHTRTSSGITGSTAVGADVRAGKSGSSPGETPPVESGGQEIHELSPTIPVFETETATAPTVTEPPIPPMPSVDSWGPATKGNKRRSSGVHGRAYYRDF